MINLINPPGIRTLTAEEGSRIKREYPDCPSGPEQCPTCDGTGKFLWWDDPSSPDRVAVVYECECVEQWVLHRALLSAGIGLAYQRLAWTDMVWAEPGAMEKVWSYMDHREDYVRNGYGIFFHGNKGSGKTGLSALLLKALIAEGHDGYFTTFNAMIEMFTSGWRDPADKEWFHRRVKNAGVLVIDDPGKETKGIMGVPRAILDEIIRHRVSSLRPTFINTNHTLAEFQGAYGEYVMSLLSERATTYEFTGADVRHRSRERTDTEIEMGLHRPMVIG